MEEKRSGGSEQKKKIEAHRFYDCQTIVLPHMGVVVILKTDSFGGDVEVSDGEGPSLNVLFSIGDARRVAAILNASAENAEKGTNPHSQNTERAN